MRRLPAIISKLSDYFNISFSQASLFDYVRRGCPSQYPSGVITGALPILISAALITKLPSLEYFNSHSDSQPI